MIVGKAWSLSWRFKCCLFSHIHVVLYALQISAMHAPVSDAMIVDKARSLSMELSIAPEDFKVSDGWLYRFKRRHELPTARKKGMELWMATAEDCAHRPDSCALLSCRRTGRKVQSHGYCS